MTLSMSQSARVDVATPNLEPTQSAASIDVLIPVFNAAKTIRASIESIQKQTFTNLRTIVVDDGSTDETPTILAEMAAADPRIIVLRQSNQGIVHALNNGLAIAEAAYVARHDADDIAYANRLQRQLDFLQQHSDYVAVGANAWHIDDAGARLGTRTVFFGDVDPDPFSVPAREPYLMHPFLLVRRDALLAAGGYRHCFHAEDADLYWRLLTIGKLHNLSDLLGEYRVHAGSISSASARNGRIAAKYSQLAALSHRRRLQGRLDLVFDGGDLAILNEAKDFADVLAHKSYLMDEAEAVFLKQASAAKLVDIACYRPFSLGIADCRQVAAELRNMSGIPTSQRLLIQRSQAEVLRRYIDAGLWQQIRAFRFPLAIFFRLPRRYAWKIYNKFQMQRA